MCTVTYSYFTLHTANVIHYSNRPHHWPLGLKGVFKALSFRDLMQSPPNQCAEMAFVVRSFAQNEKCVTQTVYSKLFLPSMCFNSLTVYFHFM